jgi:hypothetical protein
MAVEFHVTDAAGFYDALYEAARNDEDDTIYLAAGTYPGNFTYVSRNARSLAITGEPGTSAETIILNGVEPTMMTLYLSSNVDGSSVDVEGLTIRNGGFSGLHLFSDDVTLGISARSLIIENNSTTYMGGGIYILTQENGAIKMEIWDCVIRNNEAPGNAEGRLGRGGGIYAFAGHGNSTIDLLIANTLIYKNQANWSGGGVDLSASSFGDNNTIRASVINTTIIGNTLTDPDTAWGPGAGINVVAFGGTGTVASVELYNTIVHGNTQPGGEPDDLTIVHDPPATTALVNASHSNIGSVFLNTWTGGTPTYNPISVIDDDPLFINPGNDDYRLADNSPCVDTGTNSAPHLPILDFEGDSRAIDGDQDGTDTVDMGADEYVPTIYSLVTLLSPNGKEAIPSGSTRTVRWGAPSEATKFKLAYSRDNGKSWRQIHNEPFVEGTSYDWDVPRPMKNEKNCFIRVCGFDESNKKVGCDRSENPFTVEVVRLISPNGEEAWDSGSDQTIRWTTHETKAPVAKVNLYLSKNGGKSWKLIGSETGDPGSHTWTLPMLEKTKDQCKVKVQLRDVNRRVVGEDVSDGVFTINLAP